MGEEIPALSSNSLLKIVSSPACEDLTCGGEAVGVGQGVWAGQALGVVSGAESLWGNGLWIGGVGVEMLAGFRVAGFWKIVRCLNLIGTHLVLTCQAFVSQGCSYWDGMSSCDRAVVSASPVFRIHPHTGYSFGNSVDLEASAGSCGFFAAAVGYGTHALHPFLVSSHLHDKCRRGPDSLVQQGLSCEWFLEYHYWFVIHVVGHTQCT